MEDATENSEEIPTRPMINMELAKIVREQAAKNKNTEEEIERLKKGQADKGVTSALDGEGEEEEERLLLPADQRQFVKALNRVGRRDNRAELPTFSRNMNPKECMDWIEAMINYFECEEVPKNQRVKVAKSKMKGPTLSWWNFL